MSPVNKKIFACIWLAIAVCVQITSLIEPNDFLLLTG